MLYYNLGELQDLLRKTGLYTEKKLGQNFLFNPQVIQKIIQTADLQADDQVIEIGPGLGILTMEILPKVKKLISVEKDQKLIPYLQDLFHKYPDFLLVQQDVLDYPPPAGPYKIVANIPYYITSPIINHFLQVDQSRRPDSLTILTQLEVAQKICSKPGDHSVLSLQTQLYTEPKIIDRISPYNFYPTPKVQSAILHLKTLPRPRLQRDREFLEIIKKAFSQKRKNLSNALQGFHNLSKEDLSLLLQKAGLEPGARAQQLDFQDWDRLLDLIFGRV